MSVVSPKYLFNNKFFTADFSLLLAMAKLQALIIFVHSST